MSKILRWHPSQFHESRVVTIDLDDDMRLTVKSGEFHDWMLQWDLKGLTPELEGPRSIYDLSLELVDAGTRLAPVATGGEEGEVICRS